ncbi:hypothetical protein LTR37_003086 [Vermiconidia calcicola]|uniref:Uncharacterized protein n=1 Tax=Vermiconidia calcicola TaxID=1690605 RepID=A0ACC3NRV2_9PEZI|nr:hypothetical protein LTR37_003086 [Vermiconidia calcicola]
MLKTMLTSLKSKRVEPEEQPPLPPLALTYISLALPALKRAGLNDDFFAFREFAMLHFDTDVYERAFSTAESEMLPPYLSVEEDYEYAKQHLIKAVTEIRREMARNMPGSEDLWRDFKNLFLGMKGRAKERECDKICAEMEECSVSGLLDGVLTEEDVAEIDELLGTEEFADAVEVQRGGETIWRRALRQVPEVLVAKRS